MKRYRIITKEILVDNVYDQEEALTIVQMFAEKEIYNYTSTVEKT